VAKLRLGRIQTSATAFKPTLAWAKIAEGRRSMICDTPWAGLWLAHGVDMVTVQA
jgi:hypothetical protein